MRILSKIWLLDTLRGGDGGGRASLGGLPTQDLSGGVMSRMLILTSS